MFASFFQSLRFRIIASVVAIEIVMLSIMVWNNVELIYRTHADRLNETARGTVRQFASAAASYMAEVNYAGLQELAENLVRQNEVSYLVVVNSKNVPIIQIGRKFSEVPAQADAYPTKASDNTFDVSSEMSISGLKLGRVYMGFSLAYMIDSIRQARDRSIYIALTEIVLSALATIMLGLSLTKNLKALADAARRVGAGDYDTLLDIKRNDEVGMTARAFNAMAGDIAKRTEQINESESSVRLLMNSTAEAIIGINNELVCIFVNKSCVEMLGYESADQIVGKDFHMLAHHHYPDGRVYPGEDCTIRRGARSNESYYSDEEMYIRADGSFFPVEVRTHIIERDGKRSGMVMTFVDITERKNDQARISRLNNELSLLLESTGEGIFGVDSNLRCTFVNRAATRLLGYTAAELLHQDMLKIAHYTDDADTPINRDDSLLYRCMKEHQSLLSDDEMLVTREGVVFPAQYSSSPIIENGRATGAVVVFRNIAEARALANKMDYLATHDSLTDLFNRREFELRLQYLLEEINADDTEHVLCYLDLDQFKVVNDTCGHVAGDQLLRQLSGILNNKIRKNDTLARLGGDEFGLILSHCNIQAGLKIIEEILSTVNDFRFFWEDKVFSVGVSIGVTAINSRTGKLGIALSEADAACYIAKDSGRNRVHVYEKDNVDIAHSIGEMRWVSVINSALDNGVLFLHYQPIVPMKPRGQDTRSMSTHFEVLLRLQDEHGSYLPLGAIIPAAERYSLMGKIDTWVVQSLFRWFSEHPLLLDRIELCAINLSATSLNDETFLKNLCIWIQKWAIPGEKICFEITETAAVSNLSQAVHFIQTLKQFGCKFALDDFGSGMSSFAYLKNLPVDFLKIDGHFVRDIVGDKIDAAMVEAVNKVGQIMNIKTIAEFVENDDIFDKLQKIGIDFAQGYAISRPMPLASLSENIGDSVVSA